MTQGSSLDRGCIHPLFCRRATATATATAAASGWGSDEASSAGAALVGPRQSTRGGGAAAACSVMSSWLQPGMTGRQAPSQTQWRRCPSAKQPPPPAPPPPHPPTRPAQPPLTTRVSYRTHPFLSSTLILCSAFCSCLAWSLLMYMERSLKKVGPTWRAGACAAAGSGEGGVE